MWLLHVVVQFLNFFMCIHFNLFYIVSNIYKSQSVVNSLIEPVHDKTKKMTCAPSEDSDQPGHPPNLIRVFAVCMKKPWVLSYLLNVQQKL